VLTTSTPINPAIVLILSPIVGLGLGRLLHSLYSIRRPYQYLLIFCSFVIALWAILYSLEPLLITLLLGWALLCLAYIDVAVLRLPDLLTLPLLLAGLGVTAALHQNLVEHGLSAGIAFGLFWGLNRAYIFLRGRSGLGLGDAKLFAAAGAWVGWRPLPTLLLLACAGGLIWTAVRLMRSGSEAAQRPLPFGAPLCAAFWFVWCNVYSAT